MQLALYEKSKDAYEGSMWMIPAHVFCQGNLEQALQWISGNVL